MAIILELNMICVRPFDINILQSITDYDLNFSIDNVSCIDNWMWENQTIKKSLL